MWKWQHNFVQFRGSYCWWKKYTFPLGHHTRDVDLAPLATAENTSGLCWPKKQAFHYHPQQTTWRKAQQLLLDTLMAIYNKLFLFKFWPIVPGEVFRSVFIAGEKSIHYHSDHRMKDLLFFTIAFQPWCLNAPQSQALPLITELSNGEGANRKRTHDVDLANLATAENTVGLCWSKNRHSVITHTRLLGWLTLAWNARGKICRSFFCSDFGTSFLDSIFQVLSCFW